MSNSASRRDRPEVVINIHDAVKKYGGNTVISGLSLHINGGEFFTLLGPSGCGKTTLLRMIAGFNTIEGGDFFFNDTRINDLDPAKRNIGMVFQNYAIFPHMNVRKNVEFGLKNRNFERSKIHDQADRFLKLMQIDQLADRMPAQLSGGQQQRVALARALCIEPQVLLMDEPLSNLDAKLRVEMRTAIKEIQNHVGITTVYVTHDQEEAMAVSDRIAVMNAGVIQHVGTPKNIYQRPANVFVATFIGRSNMMEGTLRVEAGRAVVELPTGYQAVFNNVLPEELKGQKVKVCVRPEELLLENGDEGLKAVVDDCVFLGLNTHYFIHLISGEKVEVIQESTIDSIIEPGTEVRLRLNTDKANLFCEDGSRNLLAGVKNDAQDVPATAQGGVRLSAAGLASLS
ncbi:MAG: ABC transporter ATP-binding protein [Fretibacterium sp.]|nr:ABC transporter ATP-binding protein [Fretibacterium sp.]